MSTFHRTKEAGNGFTDFGPTNGVDFAEQRPSCPAARTIGVPSGSPCTSAWTLICPRSASHIRTRQVPSLASPSVHALNPEQRSGVRLSVAVGVGNGFPVHLPWVAPEDAEPGASHIADTTNAPKSKTALLMTSSRSLRPHPCSFALGAKMESGTHNPITSDITFRKTRALDTHKYLHDNILWRVSEFLLCAVPACHRNRQGSMSRDPTALMEEE